MSVIKILYVPDPREEVHGETLQLLRRYANENLSVYRNFYTDVSEVKVYPFYQYQSVDEGAVSWLKHEAGLYDLIIGYDLGALTAACCSFKRRLVINPCLAPSVDYASFVEYPWELEEYRSLEKQLGCFSNKGDSRLCIGCFAKDDELYANRYRSEFEKSFPETYEIPGGHKLTDEAAKLIMTEIIPSILHRFRATQGLGHIYENYWDVHSEEVHSASYENEEVIRASDECGCFSCGSIYPSSEVLHFNNHTAFCPYCHIDSVIGDASGLPISQDFLEDMKEAWFGFDEDDYNEEDEDFECEEDSSDDDDESASVPHYMAMAEDGKKTIYFDLIGVLGDFETFIQSQGSEIRNEYKGRYNEIPGVFAQLKPKRGALEAVQELSEYFRCRAVCRPPEDNESALSDMFLWLEQYFGDVLDEYPAIPDFMLEHCDVEDIIIYDKSVIDPLAFEGEWIDYGSAVFPNWEKIMEYVMTYFA